MGKIRMNAVKPEGGKDLVEGNGVLEWWRWEGQGSRTKTVTDPTQPKGGTSGTSRRTPRGRDGDQPAHQNYEL